MAVVAAKWIAGDDYSVEIKRIKNKRTVGDNTVTVPTTINSRKEKRKERRKKKQL